MSERSAKLSFTLCDWLEAGYGEPEERATLGSLRITAGQRPPVVLTEVEDTIAQSVRSHINVPLVSVAEWMLSNWWRLRWEQRPQNPSPAWRRVHSLAGIGGDSVWPGLEFASDGEFIQLNLKAEARTDVSAIRFLRDVVLETPAHDFEQAVDRLVALVEARLSVRLPQYRLLSELRAELVEERSSAQLSKRCRWQALAGIDPGEASALRLSASWSQRAESLISEVGHLAGNELMGVLPQLGENGLQTAVEVVERMKQSTVSLDLRQLGTASPKETTDIHELPWQKGARLAQELREKHGLGTEPLTNQRLSQLLDAPVPLQLSNPLQKTALSGGFRNGVDGGRARILWPGKRAESQRFFLARMMGAALVLPPDEHVIPVANTSSALQKLERSFAQEFLCPWAALDAFTDEAGLDDDALLNAAEHFQVSEWTVRSTLVNRGKLSRDWLPSQA